MNEKPSNAKTHTANIGDAASTQDDWPASRYALQLEFPAKFRRRGKERKIGALTTSGQ
jgi:hypothetical protein